MNCRDCQNLISDGPEVPPAVLAHIETCPSCRTSLERELAGEPLPLRKLPLLELPAGCRNPPELPGADRLAIDRREGKAQPTGWGEWLETGFGSWMPALGMVVLVAVISGMLIKTGLQPGTKGQQLAEIDVAALSRLAVQATAAAGPATPDPVFVREDGRSDPIVFAAADNSSGRESDEETESGDSMAGSITFENESLQTVSFVMEERVPTFFDINSDEEESNNG